MSNPNFRPKSWQSTLLPPGSRAPCGQLLAMPEIIFWMGELSGVCHLVHLFCIHLVANILKIFFVYPILGGTQQQIRQGSCSCGTYVLLGVEIQAINK